MLRGFALYCAKMVHSSIEINQCNFKLYWRLINHQDCETSSRSFLKTYPDKYAQGVFLDLDESGVGCQMGDAILIHFLSLSRSSLS